MTDETTQAPQEDWGAFTKRLRDDTKRQIAEQKKTQDDVKKWYGRKPGGVSQKLELHQCPSLLRVMQIIRSLRETLAEFEHAMRDNNLNPK
jgi:hypothetical protein